MEVEKIFSAPLLIYSKAKALPGVSLLLLLLLLLLLSFLCVITMDAHALVDVVVAVGGGSVASGSQWRYRVLQLD